MDKEEIVLIENREFDGFTIPKGNYMMYSRGENGCILEKGPITITIDKETYENLFKKVIVLSKDYEAMVTSGSILTLYTDYGIKEVCITKITYDEEKKEGTLLIKDIPQNP